MTMTHKPEPQDDPLAFLDPIADRIAKNLKKHQIDQIRFAFAYHLRNFVEPVSLPTKEKENENDQKE